MGRWKFLSVLIFLVTVIIIRDVRKSDASSYRAAVVEFKPYTRPLSLIPCSKQEAQDAMMKNVESFEGFVKEAHTHGVQIIVFPEDGVTGAKFATKITRYPYMEQIPDPSEGVNPCLNNKYQDRPVLHKLSCMARQYEMVLIANVGDTQPCTSDSDPSCPQNGHYQYNTDIVLGADGKLLTKYHKTHLFDAEAWSLDFPPSLEVVTFQTSFGIFGIFTCYDILFCDPPFDLIQKGMKNIIFPTFWGSLYPFYISAHLQQGWSWRTGVNFLGANQHNIKKNAGDFYATGSGIYSAGYPLSYYLTGATFNEPFGALSIADVPLEPLSEPLPVVNGVIANVSDILMKTAYINYTNHVLTEPSGYVKVSYRNDDLNIAITCELDYKLDSTEDDVYAFTAAVMKEDENPHNNLAYAICSLVKCNDRTSCGVDLHSTGYKTSTTFTKLSIAGNFSTESVVIPTVVGNELMLLSPSLFSLSDSSLVLKKSNGVNLLSANLWTRVGKKCSL
ncbi:pantetheinase-like [Dysidea avara]|uniref:pantetheinase-like n=1 Tax=Dysidea avara TaxID=196820 RepID=UPI00332B7829